jgi:hypothetical protein
MLRQELTRISASGQIPTVAVGLVADQDAAEVVAGLRVKGLQQVAQQGIRIVHRWLTERNR